MPKSMIRARSIAACLTTAGFEPRLRRHPDHIRIEVEPPASPASVAWGALLAALEQGDEFGLSADGQGAAAWAVIFTEVPSPRPDPRDERPQQGAE
ncbi:hypothetical protein LHJ74_04460 [Streptomyces sp. N2-109]|uniref:Uncharacterized protein n=1 Tax=Streptomyces gossypii TaxID=2883101 RepID=A0ABT2JMT0_9ACTN|nr:hypothetical protein [Streptomyces gossypii]MCT2589192.1 hypothetical protein [Streptomyces gossypii]